MACDGMQGDEFTYNTYIKAASYSGDLERALRVMPHMAASGVEPTPAVWGSLIVACGKASLMLPLLHGFSCTRTVRTYSSCACKQLRVGMVQCTRERFTLHGCNLPLIHQQSVLLCKALFDLWMGMCPFC